MASLHPVPPAFKPIQHYLKTATEHDARDPIVAYYCRLYAVQKAMEIDRKSPEAKSFIANLMDRLEKDKTQIKDREEIRSDVVGQAYMENYILKLFLFADNEDRASHFTKNVVKTFYTTGVLLDVMQVFGPLTEELEKNKKYAKWKAAYIHNCLKNGETPIPGPAAEGSDDFLEFGDPQSSVSGQSNVNQQPLFPPPSQPSHPANSVPKPAPRNVPSQPAPAPQHPGSSASTSMYNNWQPPPNPEGVHLTADDYQKALKLCKYATSALQYEDSMTAIENLTKALQLLTTGQSS